jgi:hypothetical protein
MPDSPRGLPAYLAALDVTGNCPHVDAAVSFR